MKKHVKRLLSVLLSVLMVTSVLGGLDLTASAAVMTAGGVCFSVTASGSTFTVTRWTRTGELPGQNVIVRTVDLTAFGNIHYDPVYTYLAFDPGETTKTVTVTEYTSAQVAQSQYSTEVDLYQSGTTRAYRLEVLDPDGYLLASATRQITYSSSYTFNNAYILENDGEHLLYIANDYSHEESCVQSVDVRFPNTSEYTTISDRSGNGYLQGVWTASTNSLFSRSGCASREYLSAVGDKMYASFGFTGMPVDNGWEYIQILGDNAETCDDKDPDGSVNTPSLSLYKACFELNQHLGDNSYSLPDETIAVFPTLYSTEAEYKAAFGENCNGYTEIQRFMAMHDQKYQNASLRAQNTGALAVDPKVENLSVRFNARGDNNDDWKFKDLFMRLALVDMQAPTIRGISVPNGLNKKHGRVTIVVAFSEIVKPVGQCVLQSSWGNLTAEVPDGSSYANAIAFTGEITADENTVLQVKRLNGTVQDLHGRELGSFGTISDNAKVGAASTPPLSNGAYRLDSQSDFYWFADQITTDPSTSAVMTSDINMASAAAGVDPLALNGFTGTFDGGGKNGMEVIIDVLGQIIGQNP